MNELLFTVSPEEEGKRLDQFLAGHADVTRSRAEKLIRETCGTQDCALVLITHSISQARRISDRVLVLRRGVLIE